MPRSRGITTVILLYRIDHNRPGVKGGGRFHETLYDKKYQGAGSALAGYRYESYRFYGVGVVGVVEAIGYPVSFETILRFVQVVTVSPPVVLTAGFVETPFSSTLITK